VTREFVRQECLSACGRARCGQLGAFCNLLLPDQFSSRCLSPRFGASSVLRMETAPRCMVSARVFSKELWATCLGVGRGLTNCHKNDCVAMRYTRLRMCGILGGVVV
jgi:hypothetical protein